MKHRVIALVLAAFSLSLGCSSGGEIGPAISASEEEVTLRTNYEIAWDEYNAIYGTSFTNADEAYSVAVTIGDKTLITPSHLFGETVNVVPYSNDDAVSTADGRFLERGDSVIATIFQPGQLGIAVKHHRSSYPKLDFNSLPSANEMKEHFKLQDTHIEIVVGVNRDGKPGAITINNPQSYESGRFGDENYAMIFLRPVYPDYLNEQQKKAYEDNIRTLLIGFNAVTSFPGNYNGGDPLAARNPEKVREYVKNMVLAINGDKSARKWFEDPEHLVYCAELAFISFSAGLLTPLNDATMNPLVGAKQWAQFKDTIRRHNAGEETAFRSLNDNTLVRYVDTLTVAPPDLLPAAAYGPPGEENKLALEPLTMSDILDEFLRTHIPREHFGESLAPAQAAVLAGMKPALLEQMAMDSLPESDPRRVAVEDLFQQVVNAVGQTYDDYASFRAALKPLLDIARVVTGPRGDTGEGLFVPPSLFHVAAQGKRSGLLRFQYEGHGVHTSAVQYRGQPVAAPTPVSQIPTAISCQGQCGGLAPGGCYCDALCAEDPEGCCADFATVCR